MITKYFVKICFFLMFFVYTTVFVSGIESVEFTVMHEIETDSPPTGLEYASFDGMGNNPEMPRAFSVSKNDHEEFFVYDYWDESLVTINRHGNLAVVHDDLMLTATHFTYSNSFMTLISPSANYAVYDSDLQVVTTGNLVKELPVTQNDYYEVFTVVIGNLILLNPRGNQNVSYHSYEIQSNEVKYRTPEETVEYIQNEYDGEEDLRFDDNGYLFWEDRLVAPDGYTFSQYHWNTTRPDRSNPWRSSIRLGQFIGWDDENNTYWSSQDDILIVSSQGEFLHEFEITNVNRYTKSQYTMTEDGTLYVLSYNGEQEQFELMKLERFW